MCIFLDIIVLCSLNSSYSAYSPVESQWRPNLTFHNRDVEHSLYVYWTFVLQLLRTAGSFHHPLYTELFGTGVVCDLFLYSGYKSSLQCIGSFDTLSQLVVPLLCITSLIPCDPMASFGFIFGAIVVLPRNSFLF